MNWKSLLISAVALLLATPVFPQCEESFLTREVNFRTVSSIGQGDPDVATQAGRMTRVSVRTAHLRNRGDHLTIQVVYEVEELRKDFTHLFLSKEYELPAPSGCTILWYEDDRAGTAYTSSFSGKNWSWHDVSKFAKDSNSYFTRLHVKFDGKGDDDNGNAQMRGTIAVPVTLRAK